MMGASGRSFEPPPKSNNWGMGEMDSACNLMSELAELTRLLSECILVMGSFSSPSRGGGRCGLGKSSSSLSSSEKLREAFHWIDSSALVEGKKLDEQDRRARKSGAKRTRRVQYKLYAERTI